MSFSTASSRSTPTPLVLGSGSAIRRTMLEGVGLSFEIEPATLDEESVKAGFDGDTSALAAALAKGKAVDVSSRHPHAWVIGSDSIVECAGRRFDKPRSRDEAEEHLRLFSGCALTLFSAAALARDGQIDWSGVDRAVLSVRPLSDQFIAEYLDDEWPAVSGCVGVFRMEGRGATLFEAVEGSHFTVLGMPLLSLLAALRERGLMMA
ncbi:MAG: nucleoside triphosphate pyrophosphatase [Sphingomicrobium sp.]|nr:Maf family protein [Sphingomonadales bacterium]